MRRSRRTPTRPTRSSGSERGSTPTTGPGRSAGATPTTWPSSSASTPPSPWPTATGSASRRSPAAGRCRDALGLSPAGGVWVKDETGNVSGSHKARHLFGTLLEIVVAEASPLTRPARVRESGPAAPGRAPLAIAVLRQRRPRRSGRRARRRAPPGRLHPRRRRSGGRAAAARPRRRVHGLRARAGGRRRPDLPRAAARDRRRCDPVHLPGEPQRPRDRGRRDARLGDRVALSGRPVAQPAWTGSWCRSAAARCARPSSGPRGTAAATVQPRIHAVQPASVRAAWPARFERGTGPRRRRRAASRRSSPTPPATARRSCGPGSPSRTASPTGSSTTRPTTGWPCVRWHAGQRRRPARGLEATLDEANDLARTHHRHRRRPHRLGRAGRPAGPGPHPCHPPRRVRRRPVHRRRAARRHPHRRHAAEQSDEELPGSGHPVPQGLQPRRVHPGLPGRRRPGARSRATAATPTCSSTRPC